MDIINAPLPDPGRGVIEVLLPVDRHTLAKRRWRGVADDGREFGFDLAEPLDDGTVFFHAGGATYVIAQQPEPIFEIPITTPADSARIGWLVGNLHFSIEIAGDVVHVVADPALRQMLIRERIPFSEVNRVFHPARQGHVH
jgi:urease accessory protein